MSSSSFWGKADLIPILGRCWIKYLLLSSFWHVPRSLFLLCLPFFPEICFPLIVLCFEWDILVELDHFLFYKRRWCRSSQPSCFTTQDISICSLCWLSFDYSHMSHYSLKALNITLKCPRISYNKVCIWSFSPGDAIEGGMEEETQGGDTVFAELQLGFEASRSSELVSHSAGFMLISFQTFHRFTFTRGRKIRNQWSSLKLCRLSSVILSCVDCLHWVSWKVASP